MAQKAEHRNLQWHFHPQGNCINWRKKNAWIWNKPLLLWWSFVVLVMLPEGRRVSEFSLDNESEQLHCLLVGSHDYSRNQGSCKRHYSQQNLDWDNCFGSFLRWFALNFVLGAFHWGILRLKWNSGENRGGESDSEYWRIIDAKAMKKRWVLLVLKGPWYW